MPEVPVPQSHLFETTEIRSVWDDEQEEWYFSVVDVVAVLTESLNPTDYLKKLRKRDALLGDYLGTNCPQVAMKTTTGKLRKTLAATTEQLLRIIQSIPSRKAEPFKLWLAQVGSERLDQQQDPELSIEQAMRDYKTLGYSDSWINQRLKSIFDSGELDEQLVCSVLEHTTEHGAMAGKTQTRAVKYYNLDAIISVGYRVNSTQATQFRIWATQLIKEYIIKGFAMDDERLKNGRYFGQDYYRDLLELASIPLLWRGGRRSLTGWC